MDWEVFLNCPELWRLHWSSINCSLLIQLCTSLVSLHERRDMLLLIQMQVKISPELGQGQFPLCAFWCVCMCEYVCTYKIIYTVL